MHRAGVFDCLILRHARGHVVAPIEPFGERLGSFQCLDFSAMAIETALAVHIVGNHERIVAAGGLAPIDRDDLPAGLNFTRPTLVFLSLGLLA
jgi:hypothetical protein